MEKRLEKIIIKGLFNRFNYSIDLNTGENVAILSAPNGCGKTTIFNMVDCIFSPSPKKLEKILNIPFDECRCVLSNGKTVVLRNKTQNDSDILKVDKRGRKALLDVKRKRYIVGMGLSSENRGEPELLIYEGDKKLAEVNPENYTPRNLSSILQNMPYSDDYDEQGKMLDEWKYFTYVNRNRREMAYRDFIISLEKNDCDIPINYIQADRLHNSQYDNDYSSRTRSERMEKKDPLTVACEEIKVEYYLRLREEYHKRQSEASDSLPKKFLQARKKKVPLERFKQKWNAYIDDIRKFYEIGLLDSDETILTEAELENAYESNNPFLNV